MRKAITTLAIMAITILAAMPAISGNIPEFDAVGCDAANKFNDVVKLSVTNFNTDGFGQKINLLSNFSSRGENTSVQNSCSFGTNYAEYFRNTAGQCFPDPCFGSSYGSALTDAWNEGVYEWQIVLQMKPESDINLNITDCILKHNGSAPWREAEQSGRYRADWGQLFFVPTANPSVTVKAIPGPYATPGFSTPFTMDARELPGLGTVPLTNALYTSKALWEEGVVMALPETGTTTSSGETAYNLKQGDMIRVTVTIPGNNTADLRYGPDNVVLKYIGIVGTEYVANATCVSQPTAQ